MTVQLPPLPSGLNHAVAQGSVELAASALNGVEAGGLAEVDASALEQFDSSALAVLLALRRLAGERGVGLRVLGLPQRLRDLSALYGVSELLPG